jgi:hypothetical protein
MNGLLAVGLFDNPWVVVSIVIAGWLVNWLSKRRQEKQTDHRPEGEDPSPSSGKPPGEFNWEEVIRRLMGEEPPAPAPPRVPRAGRGEAPSAPDWQEEEPFQPARRPVSPVPPPLIAVPTANVTATAVSGDEEAARRFEHFNEQGRHPATVIGHGRGYRSGVGKRAASRWRDPRSARRAFVASLVFGTPKGLEP